MERTLAWDDGTVVAIDECALPAVYRNLRLTSVDDVIVRLACPESGWFRLCYATDAGTVATGINCLIRTLETS